MRKKLYRTMAWGVAAALLTACGAAAGATETGSESAAGTESENASGAEAAAETGAEEGQKEAETTADLMAELDSSLNYAKGIEEGIYGWTLSEDGSFYILSAVDAEGNPIELENASGGMMGMMGNRGGMRGGMGGREQKAESDFVDPLAMEQNQQASGLTINAQGVNIESSITNIAHQTMLVYVPAAYLTINADGSASFTDAKIGNYTAETAPIVYQNNNGGWRSGTPKAPEYVDAINAGMIYVSAGSRSRDAMAEDGTTHTGKAPTPVVDLKAGVIALRANADVIPGDKDKIISVGASGGGQMSSALGASGNMEAYYPYLYEAGAIGVTYDEASGTYTSLYDDSVYAAMAYCPIADIENADMAYAWMRYDSTVDENGALTVTAGSYDFTEFDLALQEDLAYAFAEYINSLELKDEEGNVLSFAEKEDGSLDLRGGSYYEMTLQNISDAFNKALAVVEDKAQYVQQRYGADAERFLSQNEDGTYSVTDLASFITVTELVRNKAIPGFDAQDLSAENNAFGAAATDAVHFSRSIATVMQENYERYSSMEGFKQETVDLYIENALQGPEAETIQNQTYLLNGTQIMLNVANGTEQADIARFWRTRNGTADQHTSFSVAYNITLAAEMAGAEADYALVWNMGHGSNEGTSTGTFVDWINEICLEK